MEAIVIIIVWMAGFAVGIVSMWIFQRRKWR